MAELAEVFRVAGPAYLERFGDRVVPSHRRVMRDVVSCRTPVLGGQLYECDCGEQHAVYHSCRNRHCPKCQSHAAQEWFEKQREHLLPTDYGFATCTLPEGLRELSRSHQRVVYRILIQEAARALMEVAAEDRFLGARLAVMAVLHTWSRSLFFHPHVHLVFPIGGLAEDGESWVKPKSDTYIFPQSALAARFRIRFEAALKKTPLYRLVPSHVWKERWVAHVKVVGNGEKALKYLSRYVFRVAISNEGIEAFDGERVQYRWTDSTTGEPKRATVEAHEFMRRFLQHVLPKGFQKVRYFGLWASACRKQLETARSILTEHLIAIGLRPRPIDREVHREDDSVASHLRCPSCGALFTRPPRRIPRLRGPP